MPAKSSRRRKTPALVENDPEKAAAEAGLRYVSDDQPGYTRKRRGDAFDFFDTKGKKISDETRVLRLRRLAIPPAYTDVWICPATNGHLQATGRDARGRKQYRYHERWREVRDESKYERMALFGSMLPKIRARVARDLKKRGLPREKVLATVVWLLERTLIRIGNDEYARTNKSYGLTTIRNTHVQVKGGTMTFRFRGKSGIRHEVDLEDPRLARVVRRLQDLPGQELFGYVDDDGEVRDVTSDEVNEYLQEITGEEFTAKDFRTWAGTVLAAMALHAVEPFENKSQAKKNIKTAIGAVATVLGNTPAVCRKCYIHPAVLENYLDGNAIAGLKQKTEEALEEKLEVLRPAEAAVLAFLQERLTQKAA